MKNKIAKVLIISMCISALSPSLVFADSQNDFIADMQSGLNERWADSTDTSSLDPEEEKELYTKLVNMEYEKIKKYEGESFDNAKFNSMAHAYIDALEIQLSALDYIVDVPTVYSLLWEAGYGARAVLIPDFVDFYGLQVDSETLQEFRNSKTTSESFYSPLVDGGSVDGGSGSSMVDDVNMGGQTQQPIEIYNNEGIRVTITGFAKEAYAPLVKLSLDVVNLNHRDIRFSPHDAVINDMSVQSSCGDAIQSGKTGKVIVHLYVDEFDEFDAINIKNVGLKLDIIDDQTGHPKYYIDNIFLNVNNWIVSQRTVYTDKETIQHVQQMLATLGYNTGSTDGVSGKLTNSSILQFERDHGMEENTDITPELISALENAVNQG